MRAGRGIEPTEAGTALRPHAERTLAEAAAALESVQAVRDLSGGTVAFGSSGSAHYYPVGGFVQDFRAATRASACARSARTPPRSPTRCATASSRRASSRCRSTTAGSTSGPHGEELLYVSAEPEQLREPVTIERLASSADPLRRALGAEDPARRQLRERAQRAGVSIQP